MSRIDDAVRRVLRVKFSIGLFENPFPAVENVAAEFGSEVNPRFCVYIHKCLLKTPYLIKHLKIYQGKIYLK